MDADRPGTVPYGFDDDESVAHLLRSPPPCPALAWVEQVLGGTLDSVEVLRGGLSSAMHLLRLRNGSESRDVVLRRYVRPDPPAEQADLVEREARTLRFVESVDAPTPQLLAVDPTGDHAGSPALLMTALPGRVEWVPESVEPWLVRMAEVLPLIHAADLAEAGRFPQHVPDTPSSFAPPHWTHRPDLWERAAEIYHEAAPEEARVFVHGDFHPGNLLWNENVMTGVIDWQAASIGLKSVDVANCRGNLFPYGLDMADRFTSYWEHLTGERFNPWAGLVGCVGYLDGMRDDRPTDWLVIEEALAREVAELSGP